MAKISKGEVRAFRPTVPGRRGWGRVTSVRACGNATDTEELLDAGVRLEVLGGYYAGKRILLPASRVYGLWDNVADAWLADHGEEMERLAYLCRQAVAVRDRCRQMRAALPEATIEATLGHRDATYTNVSVKFDGDRDLLGRLAEIAEDHGELAPRLTARPHDGGWRISVSASSGNGDLTLAWLADVERVLRPAETTSPVALGELVSA